MSPVDPPLAMTVDVAQCHHHAHHCLYICQSQFGSLSASFHRIAMLLPRKLLVFVTREFLFPEQTVNDRNKKQRRDSSHEPNPSDIGNIPMIIAIAVIITGRKRVKPAASAASNAFLFSCAQRSSFAKVTTKMLFAVATPMAMIAPISEGTLIVVPLRNSIQMIPHSAPGKAMMMMNGSVHD
jgi:hypothetical protein